MSKEHSKINKNKTLYIAFVMCSFIPYFGVISAWCEVFWLIKQPWFLHNGSESPLIAF